MKNRTSPEESRQSEGPIDGPGSQLRKARERQGLEQAKVAAQLHLSQAMIQALEWDDYEKLPSPVFVQGYLRNYSRLLGVNEDAVIRAYQELNPSSEQAPLPRNQPDEVAKELHSDHHIIRYVTWTVILLLGVLLFFWWQGRMDLPETESAAPAEESDNLAPGFPQSEQPEPMPAPVAPSTASPTIDEEAQPGGVEPPLEMPQPEPAMEPEMPDAVPQDAPPPAVEVPPMSINEPAFGEESEVPVMEEPRTAMPAGVLVFEFSGPCWVEVRDPTGRARIIGEMRSGIRRTLDAQLGPFQVVIGDINVASLTVNGERYDLARHARGKVARFTLDPSQL